MINPQKLIFTDPQSEELVKTYLIEHTYLPKRINTKKLPEGVKSPDFKVYEADVLKFYCEVKNPLLLVNDLTQMFHWTTSVSKIRRFIHKKAVPQFKDMDSNHSYPWILFFTSGHFQLSWVNFSDACLGYVARNGTMISDLRQEKYVINSNTDVNLIDAYIWGQVNPESAKLYQFVPFINNDSPLKSQTEKIIDKLKPTQNEDIKDMNSRGFS